MNAFSKGIILTKKCVYIAIFALPFFSLIAYNIEIYNGLRKAKEFVFTLAVCFGFLLLTIQTVFYKIKIYLSQIDAILIIFVLYILLNSVYFESQLNLVLLISFLIFYVNIKTIIQNNYIFDNYIKATDYFLCLILLFSFIEIIYAYLQFFKIINSFHTFDSVTGTFNNPGPFGGYGTFTCVILLNVLYMRSHFNLSKIKVLLIAFMLTCGILIVIQSYSRAAWVALSFCFFQIFYEKWIYIFYSKFIKQNKPFFYFCCLMSVTIVIYLLISFKLNSALGRLFIWKISLNISRENFLFGVGINNFAHSYYLEQTKYFALNSYSKIEYLTASNPSYPFNEFIRILVELGLVGFLIYIIAIIFISCKFKYLSTIETNKDVYSKIFLNGIYSILIFSFFSYPFSEIPFVFCICLSVAIVSSRESHSLYIFTVNRTFAKFFVSVVVCINISFFYYVYVNFSSYKIWEKANIEFMLERYDSANLLYNNVLNPLQNNADFLTDYGVSLYSSKKYERCIYILKKAKNTSNSYVVDMTLAQSYSNVGQIVEAEKHFIISVNNYPSLFFPKYALFQHYIKYGNIARALKMASVIKSMPVKVPSPLVANIRRNAETYLHEHSM